MVLEIIEKPVANPAATALRCWVELDDQRQLSFPAGRYPLLANAPQEILEKVRLRVQGRALRWAELDEDLWVNDAVLGRFPKQPAGG